MSERAPKAAAALVTSSVVVSFVAAVGMGCFGSSTSSSTVSAIGISPSPCVVGRTDSRKLSAVATLPDGTKRDVTSDPSTKWSSGNGNTLTVNADGTVVGVNPGVTKVTVAYQGASGSVDCTVGP